MFKRAASKPALSDLARVPANVGPIQAQTIQPQDAAAIRAVAAQNLKMFRMYEAAVSTNYNQDLGLTVESANAKILSSLYVVRGRSRTQATDDAIVKGMLRAYRNNVAGDEPFPLEMKVGKWSADGKTFTPETQTNRLIQDAWEEAGLPENCTVRGDMSRLELDHLAIACVVRDGSLLLRHRRAYRKNKFRYAVQVVDVDRLQETFMGRSDAGNVIRFSIERDEFDRPVKYWILSRHPGDLFQYNGPKPNIWREGVPAGDIIHFNNLRDRPEQDVGFPEFDSIIQHLHRAKQFEIAHVTAAIFSCVKPFVITRNKPTAAEYQGDAQNAEGQKFDKFQPAEAQILPDGYGIEGFDPKFPIESAKAFRRDNMLAVASGAGLAYGTITSDYEQYSFSTARAAQVPERDNFKVYQKHAIISYKRLHFNEWLENAIMSGALDLPMSRLEELKAAAHFNAKRWPYIQPVQDAQADGMLLEMHVKSRQDILNESETPRRFEDVIAQEASEIKIAESHDIDLTPDISLPTIKKGAPGQPQPNPDDTPEPPPKPGNGRWRVPELDDRGNDLPRINGEH